MVYTCRFAYLLEACLDVQRSVLMTGMTGVGKSVITTAALNDLSERKGVIPYTINFSAQTQAVDAQMVMESKLEKKRKTRCVRVCMCTCRACMCVFGLCVQERTVCAPCHGLLYPVFCESFQRMPHKCLPHLSHFCPSDPVNMG
jgi:hypothetical protein